MANDIGKGFDIDGFRAVMTRKGIARNNLYKLQITPPMGLSGVARSLNMPVDTQSVEDMMVYCDSVTLPGLSLATIDSKPYGYGPTELKAYAPVFNQLSASFIVDAKGYTLSFFRNWMRGIVNYTGEGKSYSSTTVNGARPFEASYKKDYETNMVLTVVSGVSLGGSAAQNNLKLEIVSQINILRAFPVMIGDTVLSYGVNDQYLTLPVTFSYFDWYADNIAATAPLGQVANSSTTVPLKPLTPGAPTRDYKGDPYTPIPTYPGNFR